MPTRPSPPRSTSRKRRDLEVVDGGRPEGQLGDLHPVDEVARGHAVEDRRRAERQLQVVRDAQADGRSVGAAVDHEVIGAAAVDLDVDAEPGVDLARLDVLAADGERVVELRPEAAAARPGAVGGAGRGLLIRGGSPADARRSPAGQHQAKREEQDTAARRHWSLH